MGFEELFAILGGAAGAWGAFRRDVLIVGIGVVLVALALIAAWLIPG